MLNFLMLMHRWRSFLAVSIHLFLKTAFGFFFEGGDNIFAKHEQTVMHSGGFFAEKPKGRCDCPDNIRNGHTHTHTHKKVMAGVVV